MAKSIGTINDNIVSLTKNDETKQFIGKNIIKKQSASGDVLYQIEDTAYCFSPEELKFFIENNTINLAQNKANASSSATVAPAVFINSVESKKVAGKTENKKNNVSQVSSAKSVSKNTSESKKDPSTANIAVKEEKERTKTKKMSENDTKTDNSHTNTTEEAEDTQIMYEAMEHSDFFDYNPQFDLEGPKHQSFLDMKENTLHKIDFNLKEKIIAELEKERLSLDVSSAPSQLK